MSLLQKHNAIPCLLIVLLTATVCVYSQMSVADLISRVKPSVVKLTTFDDSGSATRAGTGFFISKSTIVTNKHVVSGARSVGIKMFDGTSLYADRVRSIPNTDVAIIEFKAGGVFVKALPIAATLPRVGDRVIVYGAPLGLEGSVSDGIVSAFRNLQSNAYMQMTAPISPGSSGSPVLDSSGYVVGVATLYLDGGQSLNFAIPVTVFSNYVLNDISEEAPRQFETGPKTTSGIVVPSKRNLSGSWLNLINGHTYQIVDDTRQLAIKWWLDPLICKWTGDIAIGYVPGRFFVAVKPIGVDRIGVWLSAKLRPTDSEERILKILTKNTRAKPEYVLELKRN